MISDCVISPRSQEKYLSMHVAESWAFSTLALSRCLFEGEGLWCRLGHILCTDRHRDEGMRPATCTCTIQDPSPCILPTNTSIIKVVFDDGAQCPRVHSAYWVKQSWEELAPV